MAYGNEDYRDFHFKSWSNLSNEEQSNFDHQKFYKKYKQEHGLDNFKSAKDKAKTYQYDKMWRDTDEDYQSMHTKKQHSDARDVWKAGKSMDWDSTSDAYKMMIDKNLHSTWYKPPSTNTGGNDPFEDSRDTQPQGPVAPSGGSGGSSGGSTGGNSGSDPSGSSGDDSWTWNDPSKFWDEYTDGQNWGSLENQDKYGDERRLAYMSESMGWGSYENLDDRLKDSWENRGGRDAYVASKDFVRNYDSGSSGSDPSGSTPGGGGVTDGGTGQNPTTIVIDNGNTGADQGLSFTEQQTLAQEQRTWQEAENKLARDEAQTDREESRKEARIQTIIAGMNAAKNGNTWANSGGGRGPIWGGSGYSRGSRQGFSPWR